MKKITAKFIAIIATAFIVSFSTLSPAMADEKKADESCRYFLGMVSWDCGTKLTEEGRNPYQEDIARGIWLIALNILSDISVIATYLALAYVIYGGYQYIFSAGDPSKTVTGKKTLSHAFIGIAIVISASVILNTIRIVLGANFTQDCTTGACTNNDPSVMFDNFINWFIGIGGVVAGAFVVYGGIAYMTSNGEPNKITKAKNILLYAIIGLVIVGLAKVITSFAFNMINQANESSYINTTLVKELNEKQT